MITIIYYYLLYLTVYIEYKFIFKIQSYTEFLQT